MGLINNFGKHKTQKIKQMNTNTAGNTFVADDIEDIADVLKSNTKTVNVKSVFDDLKAQHALNTYRCSHNMVKVRNPYSWWKYVFVCLTYLPKGASIVEVSNFLSATTTIEIGRSTATLLVRAVRQNAPCKVRREYTQNLPSVAKMIGLKANLARKGDSGKRPFIFRLEDPKRARTILALTFPELVPLFEHIDVTKSLAR